MGGTAASGVAGLSHASVAKMHEVESKIEGAIHRAEAAVQRLTKKQA
jgi:hypothetical protein